MERTTLILKRRSSLRRVNQRVAQIIGLCAVLIVTACVSQAAQFRRVPGVRDSALAIPLDPPIPPGGDVAAYEAAAATAAQLTTKELGLPSDWTPDMLLAMQSGGPVQLPVMANPAAPPPGAASMTTTPPASPMPNLATRFQSFLPGPAAAARPFQSRSSVDNLRALICLTTAIYYEAASESEDGQRAVAQVVLNRVRHPAYPNTVCGVVFQGTERGDRLCQFSFACDGSMLRTPSRSAWATARRIAAEALAGRVFAPIGYATHYHTLAVNPAWGPKLVKAAIIGAHIFYRMPSVAGTPTAFRSAYAGGEPTPAPRIPPSQQVQLLPPPVPTYQLPLTPQMQASLANADPAMPQPVASTTQPPAPRTPLANIQPEYVRSGDPVSPRVATSSAAPQGNARSPSGYAITPDSNIQPEYSESGKWIGN